MSARLLDRRAATTILLATLGLSVACNGGADGGTQPGETAAFTLSVSPGSALVQQTSVTTVIVTLARTNFAGPVSLVVEGLPDGITASFSANPVTGNTTTLTLTASAGALIGSTTITVRGQSTLSDRTSMLSLTTAAAPPVQLFSLSASPDPIAVTQNGSPATATITISRSGGFSGAVSLTVSGEPAGLIATLDQSSTSASAATLTLRASGAVAPQRYVVTVTGKATSLPQQTPFAAVQVVVSAPPQAGNVTLDFSACDGPVWLASQDGNGAWQQVVGVNGVYRFTIASGKGAYATAWQGEYSGQFLDVQYMTQAELTAATLAFCTFAGSNVVSGTVAGLIPPSDFAMVSLGGGNATRVAFGTTGFTLYGVPKGIQDLVAYRTSSTGPSASDRVIILRDQNVPDGGSVGMIDFGGTAAFAPTPATLTVLGATGGEVVSPYLLYLTGADCSNAPLNSTSAGSASTITMYGIPSEHQRASDYHRVGISAVDGSTSSRWVEESFHTIGNRTLTLGMPLEPPTVTSLPAPYKRLAATVNIPSDYQDGAMFSYYTDIWAQVTATSGWLGGSSATLAVPDFTGVSGWRSEWGPTATATADWTFSATGSNGSAASFCAEGATVRHASRSGKK